MNSIYALTDPLTCEIRYIGKTRNVEQRHNSHCYTKAKTHVSRWIQGLRSESLFPTMIVIESGLPETEWPEAEQFWIEYYKGYGARLTNITKGGHDVVCRPTVDKSVVEVCEFIGGQTIYRIYHLSKEQQEWVRLNEQRCKDAKRLNS